MDRDSERAQVLAGFARRYRGDRLPADALRWALDPGARAADGTASPAVDVERLRRALYRRDPKPSQVAAFERAAGSWEQELALARAALPEAAGGAPPSAVHAPRRRARSRTLVPVVVVCGAGLVATGIGLAPRAPAPVAAADVVARSSVVIADADAGRSALTRTGLDGAGRFVTVTVTCQGAGHLQVRLTDGTDAGFACIAAFSRTAVQPSDGPLRRFGYTIIVSGTPDWAMTLSR